MSASLSRHRSGPAWRESAPETAGRAGDAKGTAAGQPLRQASDLCFAAHRYASRRRLSPAKTAPLRKIHTSPSLVEIAHLRNLLEAQGIGCHVRNDQLMAVGEIPFVECWPELWLQRPGDALRARAVIDLALCPSPASDPWTCPGCGERIEGQFGAVLELRSRYSGPRP